MEEKRNDEESLFREFERIPVRREHARYECALHEENRMRNVDSQGGLPHDDNRVRLLPTRSNRLGYVNASHLSVSGELELEKNYFVFLCSIAAIRELIRSFMV